MTIYAYLHTYTNAAGAEQQTLCTTFDPKFLPAGVQAQEFPDGTPLALVNGAIEPHFGAQVQKAAASALASVKQAAAVAIEGGFSWGGNQITLSRHDQLNNQLSLSVAGYAKANAVNWSAGLEVNPTTVLFANGSYWEPHQTGVTGSAEPSWVTGPVNDGSVIWEEIQFQVGTTNGNIPVNVTSALSMGASEAKFVNEVRVQYQAAKAKIQTLGSLPLWSAAAKLPKNAQIFVPVTGGVWQVFKAGTTGSVAPLFEQPTAGNVQDGAVVWSYQGQLADLISQVTF